MNVAKRLAALADAMRSSSAALPANPHALSAWLDWPNVHIGASPMSMSSVACSSQDARTQPEVAPNIGEMLRRFRQVLRDYCLRPGVLYTTTPPGSGSNVTESATIEDIYQRHAPSMYRVAISIVRDHSLAEDVVQDSVIKAWRNLDSFRGEGGFRHWLLRITHNTAVSTLRKLKDISYDPSQIPDEPVLAPDDVIGSGFMDAFSEALFELDELSRAVVTLREIEGMSYADIAQVVQTTEAVVKTRLYRARRHLAEALEPWRAA